MELLVAGVVFVVFGLAVVTVLTTSLRMWRAAETTRDAYSRGTAVLQLVEHDLRAIATDIDERTGAPRGRARVRVEIGTDLFGQPYLIAVRTYRDEHAGQSAAASTGGGGGRSPYNRYRRPRGASTQLRGVDGYAEFAYVFGPVPRERLELASGESIDGERVATDDERRVATLRTTDGYREVSRDAVVRRVPLGSGLYRGFVAPIAGPFSLFRDLAGSSGMPGSAFEERLMGALDEKYSLVSDGVLYLGFAASVDGRRFTPDAYEVNAPLGVRFDSRRRGMPSLIRVTLVVESLAGVRREARLAAPLEPGDTKLGLDR